MNEPINAIGRSKQLKTLAEERLELLNSIDEKMLFTNVSGLELTIDEYSELHCFGNGYIFIYVEDSKVITKVSNKEPLENELESCFETFTPKNLDIFC